MDISGNPAVAPRGARRIDADGLAGYLRQRLTQLEADAGLLARGAAEELLAEPPDYRAAWASLERSQQLQARATELRRVLQDHLL